VRLSDLTTWSVQPVLVALLLAAGAVLAAVRRHPRWPAWRTAAALLGLAALAVAACSGLDGRADALLSAHMVQHTVLALVAAPLLVVSAPIRLALGVLPRAPRRSLAAALHHPVIRAVAHPVAGLSVFVGALAVVHVPAVYDAALRHSLTHDVEHAALLWSAIALWAPVIGADPLPHRAGPVARVSVLVGAMTAMGILGAALAATGHPVYRAYPDVADQQLAGGVMWIGGMVVVLPALVGCAWAALLAEERRVQRREAHEGLR
jgi:cytochrome c oxidase assembly factor CtaG